MNAVPRAIKPDLPFVPSVPPQSAIPPKVDLTEIQRVTLRKRVQGIDRTWLSV
jgi:hypothetical protein